MKAFAQICLLTCFALTSASGPNQVMAFTFLLPAGASECFFQPTADSDRLEVEYQVIAGSGLDVNFVLFSPSGHRLVSEFRGSEGIHTVTPTQDGDYRLCLDNSFSKMSVKVVFFGLSVTSSGPGRDEWEGKTVVESMVDYKLEDIRASMESVHRRLERVRQAQASLRAFEARDRYLLEDNLWRVSFWSCLNLLLMITVAAAQIYTLQHLFDNNNKRTCT